MKKAITFAIIVLFLSVSILPAVRAEGLLSDFFDMIKRWFESSPLGNLFTAPVKRVEIVKISFYPETFEFNAQDFVNMSSDTSEISNFKGVISIDMSSKAVTLTESGSSLVVKETLGVINVYGMKLNALELKGMKLTLSSGNWNETTENGSVAINDFLGTGVIKEGVIELEGNVSRVIKG